MRLPEAHLINGIWSDDAGVDALDEPRSVPAADDWRAVLENVGWWGTYFGRTAFKTQAPIPLGHLPTVGRRAASFVDVVTTSGRGTGVAASVDHMRVLREAVGDHPIGLASGVTPENVHEMLPSVDAFRVASGIEREFGKLDPGRTRELAESIHAY